MLEPVAGLLISAALLAGIPVGVFLLRREIKRHIALWASRMNYTVRELKILWFPLNTPLKRSINDGWTGVARVRVSDASGRDLEGHVQITHLFRGSREEWVKTDVA